MPSRLNGLVQQLKNFCLLRDLQDLGLNYKSTAYEYCAYNLLISCLRPEVLQKALPTYQ
jgi:hypothetical protein